MRVLLIVALFAIRGRLAEDLEDDVSTDSLTTSLPAIQNSTTTSTTMASSNGLLIIENKDILGCAWPNDYASRFGFCATGSNLVLSNDSTRNIQFGVLDYKITSYLMGRCGKENLHDCVQNVEKNDLERFVTEWKLHQSHYDQFEHCLQRNTEAMNKLCGTDSPVSRVVSGSAGLQLNLLNILSQMMIQSGHSQLNVTEECLDKVAEVVHITSVLYITSEHYMGNSVLCWNVVHNECPQHCAALAKQLNCLASSCPTIPMQIFQQFGIWQWYFLNSEAARQTCSIKDDTCEARTGVSGSVVESAKSLFDLDAWKVKMQSAKVSLETSFQLPIEAILSIAVATFAGILVSVTAICMWVYGVGCSKKSSPGRQYSRLTGEGGEEQSMLTTSIDMDD